MPAFYILVGVGVVAVWFLLSSLYKPIGRYLHKVVKDAIDTMKED